MTTQPPTSTDTFAISVSLTSELLDRLQGEAARMRPPRSLAEAIPEILRRAVNLRPTPPIDPEALRRDILASAVRLDIAHRLGGVVRLPLLRAEMARFAPGLDRGTMDEALLQLEREYRIDLSVANSPSSLTPEERAQGIERFGRGLVFYVVVRT